MSKTKLIELIKLDHRDLMVKLNDMSRFVEDVVDFQSMLLESLKEQDRNTRHGCALKIHTDRPDEHHPIINLAQCSCLNYKDKDLEDL